MSSDLCSSICVVCGTSVREDETESCGREDCPLDLSRLDPCTQAAADAGCTCTLSSVNSASIDPPHEVINRNCTLHGCAAARDPDAAYEAMRDDPPPPFWEEDF